MPIDTDLVEERDRHEFMLQAVGTTLVPCEIRWVDDSERVDARGFVTDVGNVKLCSCETSAKQVDRTPRLAKDSMEPSVFLSVERSGSSLIVQHGREAIGRPGDLVMYDSTSPFTLLSETGSKIDTFRIPHSALAMSHDLIREACAVTLSPGHPVTALTNDYLTRLAADSAFFTAANADLVARPSVELIRAVIISHLRVENQVREAMAATLQVRIFEYVRNNLYDPQLSVEQVAAAHFISVRYLYKVLSTSGISLADWIRTRRLEICRKRLTDAPTTTTIASIARSAGFTDMSSFSRSFRTAYGVTPSQWREQEAAGSSR